MAHPTGDRRRRLGQMVAGAAAVITVATGVAITALPSAGATGTATARLARAAAGTDPHTPSPAFVLDRGRYVSFDHPDAALGTGATSINDLGQIAGSYYDAASVGHGFLRDSAGRFTAVSVPGAAETFPQNVDDRGRVVGEYYNVPHLLDPSSTERGFLFDHGHLTRLDPPGSVQSQATGINDRGQVVGQYFDNAGAVHGYLWQRGKFTTIDVPGAAGTSLRDINNQGRILGSVADSAGSIHGVLLDHGRVTTFDVPGGVVVPANINDRGQIVGFTVGDPANVTADSHGFLLASGATGPVTRIDKPGAASTLAFGINDRGQVSGLYFTPGAMPPGQGASSELHKKRGSVTIYRSPDSSVLTPAIQHASQPIMRSLFYGANAAGNGECSVSRHRGTTAQRMNMSSYGPVHQLFTPGYNPSRGMARTYVARRTLPRRDLHYGRENDPIHPPLGNTAWKQPIPAVGSRRGRGNGNADHDGGCRDARRRRDGRSEAARLQPGQLGF